MNQQYDLGDPAQPAISETASLTSPEPEVVTRQQAYNVCQIFQKSVHVSYAHMANMGTMAGLNIAGQQPNPLDEFDFQIQQTMVKMARDANYTFLRGEYAEAANDNQAYKTRGILNAVTTNAKTYTTLNKAKIKEMLKSVFDSGATVNGGIILLNSTMKVALTELYEDQTGFIVPSSRTIGGVAIQELVTDFGNVFISMDAMMPNDTLLFYNPSVLYAVEMNVPEKGNFFYEEKAKTGAGTKGEIFGLLGLDYGPEWFHAKLTKTT